MIAERPFARIKSRSFGAARLVTRPPQLRASRVCLRRIAMFGAYARLPGEGPRAHLGLAGEVIGTVGDDAVLTRGREAGHRFAWGDAYEALSLAGESGSLAGEDLELLAAAAYLLGNVDECRQALQRAHRAYVAAGDPRRAARCVFWVAFTLLLEGDLAPASGWLARARRLLEPGQRECPEHGLLLLPAAVQASASGDYASAGAAAGRAAEIGARVGDADLLTLALHFQGRAMVKEGRVREGLALLDEAMVAVVAGEVWPPVAGNIYCSMIDACQEIYDLRRAHEWTAALEAWWVKQPDMVTFTGQCLVHRAEIMQLHGAWREAVEETQRACERLAHAADEYATGAALYRQAEVYRARGDFAAAEDTYREASQWGHQAQPGLALLRLAEGNTGAAEASIRRVVGETTDRLPRAKLLPAHVEIMLAVGAVPAARDAAGELAEIAGDYETPALRAVAGQSLGAVLLAEGDARGALVVLRRAWDMWRELDAPYEAARVRVLIALGCRALGDEESAVLELDAARRVFGELGAAPDLTQVDRLRGKQTAAQTHGLTGRELQVLRLLATGKTNRAIAADLILAEKTVDRHVTNIFAKLGVSSRAAATAFAYEHRLL
jgi:DNA-binding CsgD family transcriptional regulator